MSVTTLSAPVQSDEVVRDILGFLDGMITGCIPLSTYAVKFLSLFNSMIDNSLHDVFVCVIRVFSDPVSVNFVSFYEVFLGLMLFAELVFCSLNYFVLFVFRRQQL